MIQGEEGLGLRARGTRLLPVLGARPPALSAVSDDTVDIYAISVYTFIGGNETCISTAKKSALSLYLYRREGSRPLC